MVIDINPTAEASYARTLLSRGCPEALAMQVAKLLVQAPDRAGLSAQEEYLVQQAYSYTAKCA